MLRFLLSCLATSVLVATIPNVGRAAQHAYHLTEVYTNADGSIQFIELVAEGGGQTQIAGRSVAASQGTTTHSFPFTNHLPSVIAGRKLLLATQGYADVALAQSLPAPDVILPNQFIPFQGVEDITIDFLPEDTRTGPVTFPAANLPTDGSLAMLPEANPSSGLPPNQVAPPGTTPTRLGGSATLELPFVTAVNSPMNLAGASGTIVLEVAPAVPAIGTLGALVGALLMSALVLLRPRDGSLLRTADSRGQR